MQLRLLRYFVTLARERHFARAADACAVTQPTLSAGLAALEAQLGKRLVERDRRFVGLTAEGEALLPWAQRILDASEGMRQAVDAAAGPLRGELRLGAIPASMPVTGDFARALHAAHPHVTLGIRSLTSRELERALAGFELDVGITYLDHEAPAHVANVPLYAERSMFVAPAGSPLGEKAVVDWADVARHPLCLLHQGMQNRRILDMHLAARGIAIRPEATADSYVALLAMVRSGTFATIVPDSYAGLLPGWAHAIPFADPLPPSRIGLIVPDRAPPVPLAVVATRIAEGLARI